tara:strand:- start:1206 stop:2114 length:909 start_codon:yes stop_codon:yes gene_type:complete
MLCSCGRPVLYAENDADKKAIEDLKRQARDQSGAAAELTTARVKQLQAEVAAERSYEAAIKSANKSLMQTIKAAVGTARIKLILAKDDDQLLQFVLENGYGIAVDEFIDQADKIRETVKDTLSVTTSGFNINSIDTQVDTLQILTAQAVFDEVVIPTVKLNIREGLRDLSFGVPEETVVSNLQARMESSTARQLTSIKTRISQYGRSVNSVAAKAAGLDNYLYTGPRDGVTREFCLELVNLVVNSSQLNKLNNGQGLSVITSGGGYNCRHSWSPVSAGFIKAAQLRKATNADIIKANTKAKR